MDRDYYRYIIISESLWQRIRCEDLDTYQVRARDTLRFGMESWGSKVELFHTRYM